MMKRKPDSVVSILLKTLRARPLLLASILLTVAAVTLLGLVPPLILKRIIDQNLVPGVPAGLRGLAFAYLTFLILIGLADFLKGLTLTKIEKRTLRSLRGAMLHKLYTVRARCLRETPVGETLSRFNTDAESVGSLFSGGAVGMLIDCLKILGILVSVLTISPAVFLASLAVIPAVAIVTRAFQTRMRAAQKKNLEELSLLNSHILESMTLSALIKRRAKERYFEALYGAKLAENYATKGRVNLFDASYAPVIQMIRAIAVAVTAMIFLKGGALGLTAGMFAASIEYLTNLLSPIESLGMELQEIQQGLAALKRIDGFLALEDDERDEALTAERVLAGGAGITFTGVSFAYEEGEPVIEDFSCAIRPRERVTFVGRTGAGKSTLFSLVMGLLVPDAGRVLIGDADASRIPDREKRKIFGYVEQTFSFVPGTVRDQVTLFDETISDERVWAALEIAGLADTVRRMEAGLDAPATDGEGFSFGQRELLSVARAVVADPPILLLDEVSAALDSATEAALNAALLAAAEGRTILSISHRSEAIAAAGRQIRVNG